MTICCKAEDRAGSCSRRARSALRLVICVLVTALVLPVCAQPSSAQNGAAPDGVVQDGAVQGGAVQGGAVQDGAVQGGADQGGADQGGADQGGAHDGVPIAVRVEPPTEPVLLGRWFDVVIYVEQPAVQADGLELMGEVPSGVRAREPQLTSTDDGHVRVRVPLSIVAEGRFAFDSLALQWLVATDTGQLVPDGRPPISLPSFEVEVGLGLPTGTAPRVAEALDPLRVPLGAADPLPFYLVLGLALLALMLFVVRSTRHVVVHVPPRPPELIAAEELARLRAHLPRTSTEVQTFVVDVSDVLRTYIGARFDVHAPDLTTEEFLGRASGHPALDDHRGSLEPFLTLCDLVKFARHVPGLEQAHGLLGTADAFVEHTREVSDAELASADHGALDGDASDGPASDGPASDSPASPGGDDSGGDDPARDHDREDAPGAARPSQPAEPARRGF